MPSPPAHNRREFLQGKAAVEAVGSLLDSATAVPGPSASAGSGEEPYLIEIARQAMACRFEIFLNAGQYPHGSAAAIEALDLVEQLEGQLSVYRDTSEVTWINRRAAAEEVAVEPRLFELLTEAARIARETAGAFDITSGPLSKVWGFFRRQGAIPAAADLADALAKVGQRHVELARDRASIRFLTPGVEINLGAIGKGYALDRAAESLAAAGVNDFLLHGGQSSVLARGARAGLADGGWSVGVGDPLRPHRRLAEIILRDRALATSGASAQFFRHAGRRYGHILDPRTGWPAEGVISATVLAPTAAEADALSTAFYTLGVTAALDYCRAHQSIGALVVFPGRNGSSVELATAGLADDEWRRFSEGDPPA